MAGATSFHELWSEVPKKERTERVQVLVALFVLAATEEACAVDSTVVREELKLRLQKKAPANVSDVLRKGTPNVDCCKPEGKLLWYLTSRGVARLETILSRPLAQKKVARPAFEVSTFDVAIVCALHNPELSAVIKSFGGENLWTTGPSFGQTHIYKTTEAKSVDGRLIRIIAGAPTHMGLTATAILATQMILLYRPTVVIMTGIAAGTKTRGRGVGDILVADPSVDYASGKITVQNGTEVFQPDPFPIPIDPRIRTLVQEDSRTRHGLDAIADTWSGDSPGSPLNIHIGALGAADQVVDSAARVADIQRNWRKLIGVEMETYALYRAAHEAPRPRPLYVSFKSVCDFAAEKGDSWQDYAAHTAAEYSKSFLSRHWTDLTSGEEHSNK